ncbi:MAG: hypothetical protein AVDCRST_MAG88-1525, partial [uncultured Thermomicrobiales bacterium]
GAGGGARDHHCAGDRGLAEGERRWAATRGGNPLETRGM